MAAHPEPKQDLIQQLKNAGLAETFITPEVLEIMGKQLKPPEHLECMTDNSDKLETKIRKILELPEVNDLFEEELKKIGFPKLDTELLVKVWKNFLENSEYKELFENLQIPKELIIDSCRKVPEKYKYCSIDNKIRRETTEKINKELDIMIRVLTLCDSVVDFDSTLPDSYLLMSIASNLHKLLAVANTFSEEQFQDAIKDAPDLNKIKLAQEKRTSLNLKLQNIISRLKNIALATPQDQFSTKEIGK